MDITKYKTAQGGVSVYTCLRASVTIGGKTTYKLFSADRLGFDVAKQMAIDWREEQLKKKEVMLTARQQERIKLASTGK